MAIKDITKRRNRYKRYVRRKAELLGMPFGTANGRLRKAILFHMARRLGMDTCFRCATKIETASELSIDHMKSWQSAEDPVETFFDPDNIAFSHLACNVGAATQPTKLDLTPLEIGRRKYGLYKDRINQTRRALRASKRRTPS